MNRQLTHQTTLAVYILVKDDTGALKLSIWLVTKLFMLFWQANRLVSYLRHDFSMLIGEAKSAINFTGKVLVICFSSLFYGLGMTR